MKTGNDDFSLTNCTSLVSILAGFAVGSVDVGADAVLLDSVGADAVVVDNGADVFVLVVLVV